MDSLLLESKDQALAARDSITHILTRKLVSLASSNRSSPLLSLTLSLTYLLEEWMSQHLRAEEWMLEHLLQGWSLPCHGFQ